MVRFNATFSDDNGYDVIFEAKSELRVIFSDPGGKFEMTMGEFQEIETKDVEAYTGEYEVIPKPEQAQELATANKKMLEDVKIKPIPYYVVSNREGGNTVIIS